MKVDVVGVDGCKGGWVALRVVEGVVCGGGVYAAFSEILAAYTGSSVIAVDIPIGLPPPYPRAADLEAKQILGPRRSSVFLVPHCAALAAPTYAEANRLNRELTGSGLSAQSYALRKKILEVAGHAARDLRVREVHPEVSFQAMAGGPLSHGKKTWSGFRQRQELLVGQGLGIPSGLDLGAAGADDVLDAAAAAWSAARIAAGTACSLPSPPSVGEDGYAAAIWY